MPGGPVLSTFLRDPEVRHLGSRLFFDAAHGLFGLAGLDTAAANLRRYRSGLGGTRTYGTDEIAAHPLLMEAEDANRSRITSRTLTGRTNNTSSPKY